MRFWVRERSKTSIFYFSRDGPAPEQWAYRAIQVAWRNYVFRYKTEFVIFFCECDVLQDGQPTVARIEMTVPKSRRMLLPNGDYKVMLKRDFEDEIVGQSID